MPDLSANLTVIRRDGYRYNGYLSFMTQNVVMAANVTATPADQATSLAITVTSGSHTNVLEDMEVEILDSSSVLKGRLRVASGGSTATILQVNELSSGRLNVVSGDKLRVLREWRIRDKLVEQSSSFRKDSRITYTDQNANPAPIANSGGAWIGWDDDSSAVAFDGSESFTVDPDSGGSVTHSWNFPDGTPSSSTVAAPTVSFSAGSRWISHVVTDSSNGKTTTQYVPVRVHDPDTDPPLSAIPEKLEGMIDGGWRATFRTRGTTTIPALPDGELIFYWEDEYYGTSKVSYGNIKASRSHVKFIGFLVRDSIEIDAETNEVRFEAVGPLAILEQLPGFSQAVISDTTPANWQELKTPTTKRAIVYLLRWHTTLFNLFDFTYTANDFSYPRFYVQQLTPLDQVREIADAVDGILSADRTGRCILRKDLHYASTAERSAAPATLPLTTADGAQLRQTRDHRFKVSQMEGRGFSTSAVPMLSVAPGEAPAEAPANGVADRLIVSSQSNLNSRTGKRYARANSLYNGLPAAAGMELELRGGYDVFDFYEEWITQTLPASSNRRGVSYAADRFTTQAISISHDAELGGKIVLLTVDHEMDGPAGQTRIVPPQAENGLPSFTSGDLNFPILDFSVAAGALNLNKGTATLAVFFGESGTLANYYVTSDANTPSAAGGPTWTAVSLGLSAGETANSFCVDAFSPLYLGTGTQVNGWLVTNNKIYRLLDIFGSFSKATRHTFSPGGRTAFITSERGFQNAVAVSSHENAAGNYWITYTSDDITWTDAVVTSGKNTFLNVPWVHVSPKSAGRTYMTGAHADPPGDMYISTSYGASPAVASSSNPPDVDVGYFSCIAHVPYHDNPNERIIYYSFDPNFGAADRYRLKRTAADGVTISDISPVFASQTYGLLGSARGLTSCDINRQRMVLCARPSALPRPWTVFRSYNAGDTWEEVGLQASGSDGEGYTRVAIAGDNPDVVWLLGWTLTATGVPSIRYSGDFLTTTDERAGNLPSLTSALPLWLAGG